MARRSAIFLAPLAALALACENQGARLLDDLLGPVSTRKGVSLSKHVQPILDQSCATFGCHAGSFPEAGMSLERGRLYDPAVGIVGVRSTETAALRVEPGDSDASYLIDKLEGSQTVGARMPLGAQPLPDRAIEIIRTWIDDGAPDN